MRCRGSGRTELVRVHTSETKAFVEVMEGLHEDSSRQTKMHLFRQAV